MRSCIKPQDLNKTKERYPALGESVGFIYRGNEKQDIVVEVNIVRRLPQVSKVRELFVTYHYMDKAENWRFFRGNNFYLYKSALANKKQIMLVNNNFNRVEAYLLPKENKDYLWSIDDIVYDFLQVLLINYFAWHQNGLIIHCLAIKDLKNKGIIFAGKSGTGKSTLARLWYQHSRAKVINDDRAIIRRRYNRFWVFGCPWHGDFRDYLDAPLESAPLDKILFIHHALLNKGKSVQPKEAFQLLYTSLFPTFWDKLNLEHIVSCSRDLLIEVPCYSLGFVNNREVIKFVRRLGKNA
jgi:hypothetical protein